jgi:hypothetical protein
MSSIVELIQSRVNSNANRQHISRQKAILRINRVGVRKAFSENEIETFSLMLSETFHTEVSHREAIDLLRAGCKRLLSQPF